MKISIPILVVSTLLAGGTLTLAQDSENLLQDLSFKFQKGTPASMVSGSLVPATDVEPTDEDSVLLEGFVVMTSVQQIPVDPENTYELSGWFKSTGSKPSKLFFGLRPLDENKIDIWPSQISWVAGSDTELAADASVGDTLVKIKNGIKWGSGANLYVAFHTDPSGALEDLPNRNLALIGSVQQAGEVWEVKLAEPLKENYPAGTPVRQHAPFGMQIYCGANGGEVPFEWTFYRCTIRGEAKGNVNNAFWPKTRFVSILVAGNYEGDPDVTLLVGGLKFREN